MRQKILRNLVFVLLSVPTIQSAIAQSTPIIEHNVAMKTRDGVTLKADIYLPAGEGPFPVLLTRTPYNKDGMSPIGLKGAARGFMVVAQDTRGRYASEGEWYPFKYESNDATTRSNGPRLCLTPTARSACSPVRMSAPRRCWRPLLVRRTLPGFCPIVTASNYHENWTYQGGAFEQWFNESWTSGLAQNTLARKIEHATNATVTKSILPLSQYPLFNSHLDPGAASSTAQLAPYFIDWLSHPLYDDYWKQWSIEEHFQDIQVPALTIAAWYDIFQGGSIRNYMGLHAHAGNEAARKGQHLLVAIGGHSGWGQTVGALDFGPQAPFSENDTILDWYDYLFLGKQNEFANGKPVKIFVMGKNEWRYEDSWPPERAKETRYLLHSTGSANSSAGSGLLYTAPMEFRSEAPDTFVYDPADPVPTVGGPLCCDGEHMPPGPRDQKEVESRPDVLVYSTPPLEQDLEVTGPVTLDLFAKSSTVDTDFTAKLVDVWPDGKAINLTEGILRARFRESTKGDAKPIEPGKTYEYKIDLWSTSNVFLKGHRIRLEVSSSNFPRFDRNLNTGKDAATSAEFVKATNTVLHDAEHPSALLLPVIPR